MSTSINLARLEITVHSANATITRFARTMPASFLPRPGDRVQVFEDSTLCAEVVSRSWDFQGVPVLHLQDIYTTPRQGYGGIIWSTTGRTGDPRTALLKSGWEQVTRG